MTAYGGNLTVFHRFLFSGASVEDSELIMKGGGLERVLRAMYAKGLFIEIPARMGSKLLA